MTLLHFILMHQLCLVLIWLVSHFIFHRIISNMISRDKQLYYAFIDLARLLMMLTDIHVINGFNLLNLPYLASKTLDNVHI